MKQQTIEWRQIPLGEILDYEQPQNYIVGSTDYKDEYKTPVLTAGKSFILGYTNETRGVYDKLPVIIFDDFTTDTKFVNFKFKVKSSAMKMLTSKNKEINLKFVFLMMKGIKANSISHKRYYLSIYQNIKILLPFSNNKPDLAEQQRIVSILEKAEKQKERSKQANNLLDEYLKSVFNEMFYDKGFNETFLGNKDYFEITMGQSPVGTSYNKIGKGTPFFQGKKEFGEKYPSVEQWTTEPSKLAKPNDILISVRAPVGSINLANIKCCIGRGLASIRCKEEIKMDFVYSFLKVKEKEIENLGNGSTFKAITSGQLLGIKIPLPPLPLQQKFANIVEKVEKMKENVRKTKQTSEELFNSLMQKAFRGEL